MPQNPTRDQPSDDSSAADAFERLVHECLDRLETEGDSAIDTICANHPEHAERIRKHLDWLTGAGLIDTKIVPERLGEFRLIRRLGGGGMGEVYLAQQDGLDREVALKVMRPEQLYFAGSKERFQREVEAIARLKHPGIVPIFTVGEANGVPYYAMDRVEGCTLAELLTAVQGTRAEKLTGGDFLDGIDRLLDLEDTGGPKQRETPTPESLQGSWVDTCFRLVGQVAHAMDHSHARGVIHRDIKPSNIMLTRDGRALLLDFGLASSEGTSKLTRSGARVGSLPYMSPEQLDGRSLDERTDIYSLGVTLYELLTLREPYAGVTTQSTTQLILDGRPRAIHLFNRRVPSDAETVCLAAMEADRKRRYPSAAAFADDLERFVQRRPVQAKRPGIILRTRRWVQRRPAATVAIVLAFFLIAGLPTTLLIQEKAAAAVIQRKADTATRVTELLISLFEGSDRAHTEGVALPARVILDRAAKRLETELDDEPEIKSALLYTLGSVYGNLGLHDDAERLLRSALQFNLPTPTDDAIHTARCQNALGIVLGEIGRYEDAESHYRQAIALRRTMARPGDTSLPSVMSGLGSLLRRMGRDEEARTWLEDAVRQQRRLVRGDHQHLVVVLHNLGIFLMDRVHPTEALPVLREARDMCRRVYGGDHVYTLIVQTALARALGLKGEIASAETEFAEAVRLAELLLDSDDLQVAVVNTAFASFLVATSRATEARPLLERALKIRQAALPKDHPFVAWSFNDLGGALQQMGDHRGARRHFEKAVEIYRKAYPGDHADLAIALGNLSVVAPDRVKLARESVEMHRRLESPDTGPLASSLSDLGIALAFERKFKAARESVSESVRLSKHRYPGGNTRTALALNARSFILLLAEDGKAAQANAEEALTMWRSLFASNHQGTAKAMFHLGWATRLQRSYKVAEEHLVAARDMQRQLDPKGSRALAYTLLELGPVLALQENLPDAEAALEESFKLGVKYFEPGHRSLTRSILDFSRVLEMRGKLPRAEQLGWECLELQRQGRSILGWWAHQSAHRMRQFIDAHQKGGKGIAPLVKLLDYTTDLFPRYYGHIGNIASSLTTRCIAAERFDEADSAMRKGLKRLPPTSTGAYVLLQQLIRLHEASGDGKAVTVLQERLKSATKPPARVRKK